MNWLAENSNAVIALTAILATFTSAYSILRGEANAKAQRLHNKLSVKPIGQIAVGDWQDRLYVGLENAGSGPLIVHTLRIIENGELQHEHLIELMPRLPVGTYWKNFIREGIEGRAILPGNVLKLVELEIDDRRSEQGSIRDEVRRTLAKYEIVLEYGDIYDQKVRKVTRHLTWFVRHWQGSENEVKR